MFIINITYKVKLDKVDRFLEEHINFLNKQYELKNFIASGAKKPRTGGIILSQLKSKLEIEKIINEDPFKINGLAKYELIEFAPSKASEELKNLIEV